MVLEKHIKLSHGSAKICKMPGVGCYLMSIFVEEDYRNKGTGTLLMEKALQQCGRPLYLLVTDELGGNVERLTQFYRRFGFVDYKQKQSDGLWYNANMVLWE